MKSDPQLARLLKSGAQFMPSLSVDCVIFGFHDSQLKVLLLKNRDQATWGLPGGFVQRKEDVDEAAVRVLGERTGLSEIFLQQFHLFGQPDRSEAAFHRSNLNKSGIELPADHWLLQRFVTVGYYALVEYSRVKPQKDSFSDDVNWHEIHSLPKLMMDHSSIVEKALEALRLHLRYHPLGYTLLPPKFTMPQLQKLYETILDRPLDRRNFQRRMINYGILKRLQETQKGGAHKAPFLYRFDLPAYRKALKEGWEGGW